MPDVELIPFSIIDEAIHLLDHEAAPWSIQLELRVRGHLDEARLRAALAGALLRHPLACARKKATHPSVHRDMWEIPMTTDVDPLRVVDCPDDAALAAVRADLQSFAVPLAESPPLRVRLARHSDGDVVMLNVNHSAMDGFGALRVLQSIARDYTGEPDPPPALALAEARDLPNRLAAPKLSTRLRRQLVLAQRLHDLILPPARLAKDGPSGDAGYGFHHVTLSAHQTKSLISLHHAGTVNDVLLAGLHLAIDGWNTEHGDRCERIGVLVPANLRPREWRNDIVSNFSLPARLATTRRQRSSPMATLEAITTQSTRKKKSGMGTAFIELLDRSHLFPLWVKQLMVMALPLTGNRLVDTAMLSNLGRLDDPPSFGPASGEMSEVWFSPPARMPLGLSIGAATASGQMFLSLRYRHRLFGAEAARRFADRYLAELQHFVDLANDQREAGTTTDDRTNGTSRRPSRLRRRAA